MLLARLLVLAVVLAVSAGCAGDGGRGAAGGGSPPVAPRLGGEQSEPADPPARPMDRVEEAVAAQLDDELAEQRLSVDYLACPEWRHPSSQHETCRGYVEGVVVDVEVWLHGPADNRVFDARLGSGVLATANLVDRLVAAGYHRVDCGDRPAYPTVVGDRIICAVTRDGRRSFVVATVTTGDGEVAISDY